MREIQKLPFMKGLIDFWSIPHFLFGAVTALVAGVWTISYGPAFLATVILAVSWEIFEWKIDVQETFKNRLSDVMFPLVAFVATETYTRSFVSDQNRRLALLVVTTLLFLYVNFLAWRARSRRDRDFMN